MTDKRDDLERDALAAERALGLLGSREEREAATLEAADPAFAAAVARWRGRLGPMLDEIEPVEPPAEMWQRIEQATRGSTDDSNVIVLRRSIARWRALGVGMTALAASLNRRASCGTGDRMWGTEGRVESSLMTSHTEPGATGE